MIPPLLKEIRQDLREHFGLTSDTLFSGKDVAIVVGQNGSGKSFLRRMIRIGCKQRKISCFDLSQERRSSTDISSALIYGSESWESTGIITLRTFIVGLKPRDDGPYLLLWDEPEIGLSEESQLGLVRYIREKLAEADKNLLGIVFMTHSRVFVQQWADYDKLAFVDLEGKYATPEEWLDRKVRPANIEKIVERGHKKFRKLSRMMKRKSA